MTRHHRPDARRRGATPSARERVRPSVALIAATFVAVSGLAIYVAARHESPLGAPTADADPAHAGRGRDRGAARARGSRVRAGTSGSTGSYRHHDWGQETELARAMALGLPGPNFWQERATRGAPDDDPQLAAMWRSYAGEIPPEASAPPLPFEPTARRARLVDAEGAVASAPSSCDVRVLPVRTGQFNCVVRVMCDGQVLYPNPTQTAGYVPCEVENGRAVRAVDDGHTSQDGDPLVSLDLDSGTVTVEEFDAQGARTYRATLRLDG